MKRLESIKVVNFYLFEREDIRCGEITGIFGPNASGKSSLIDAIQIAMFGANGNLVTLNAQADENKSARTIKSYCLGMNDERVVRDNSTTYITLLWRDTETQEPLSMGVCIYASTGSDSHEVRGRYVLPGVELAMHDHLEMVDNKEQPRAWESFRIQLKERSKVSGEDPLYTDSERYIKAVLHALRGAGGVPSPEAFKSAFRFALKMKFNDQVDEVIRRDILEARPTNIQRFKEVTDTFKRLRDKIKEIRTKIEDGEKVERELNAAAEASIRAATWGGLNALALREDAAAKADDAIGKLQRAQDSLDELNRQSGALNKRLHEAKSSAEVAVNMRINHSAHQENGLRQARIDDQQRAAGKSSSDISGALLFAANTLKTATSNPHLHGISSEIAAVQSQVVALRQEDLSKFSAEDFSKALKPISAIASKAINELRPVRAAMDTKLDQERTLQKGLQEALERVNQGRARLSPNVESLMAELKDNGLNPEPVCDLVRISDKSWQPVIEAYLGRNVEALLIDGPDKEAKAFGIYRGLTGSRAIFGAKIVAASKQHDVQPSPGSVAELIEGDHRAAVSYLRRRFGDMMRAESDKEAISGKRTLTQDGMIVQSGEYERIRLVSLPDIKIGAGEPGQQDAVKREIRESKGRIQQLESSIAEIDKLTNALLLLGESSFSSRAIEAHETLKNAGLELTKLQAQAESAADQEYAALFDAENKAKLLVDDLQKQLNSIAGKIGAAETLVAQCTTEEVSADSTLERASQIAEQTISNAEYDQDYASRQWDALLEKFEDRYPEMADHCASQQVASTKAMNNAVSRGRQEFGTFRQKYSGDAGPVDGGNDWRIIREWIGMLLGRLRDTELVNYEEQVADAYEASKETFRTDVAVALSTNLDQMGLSMDKLNQVLRTCPAFTNGERYQFRRTVKPHLSDLLRFVKDIAAHGPGGDLFGNAGQMPEEFEKLLGEKIAPGSAGAPNPLDDYREFFDFDIEILREDPIEKKLVGVGTLSRRAKSGSGGEHRAPLYVIAGAALASAYKLDAGNTDGIRLILLDEAFNKMDAGNILATMRYMEAIGLQVFLASPGENQGTLTAFLHRYYDIVRDAETSTALISGHDVSEETREMFRGDFPEFNDTLLAEELATMRAGKSEAAVAGA
jgi:energy-coupling factor transporter ATP-binding protein EcfA2